MVSVYLHHVDVDDLADVLLGMLILPLLSLSPACRRRHGETAQAMGGREGKAVQSKLEVSSIS